MIRRFISGNKVYFRVQTTARKSPDPNGTIVRINKGAHGVVKSYSKEGTENVVEDDFVGVEIIDGDEAEGSVVWVPFSEFDNLIKKY